MRYDDWLDESEYPDDDDIAAFGDDSPVDNDPRTIGYVDGVQQPFWTAGRVIVAVMVALLVAALILPFLLGWL